MSRPLLMEIGVEELPASYVAAALAALPDLVRPALEAARLSHGEVRAYGTPRRLTVYVDDLADRQADLEETVLGPPKAAAFEADGTPKKAAIGFAKKLGVDVSALTVEATDKGEYVAGRREEAGRSAAEVLPELLGAVIPKIPFRKSMRWGEGEVAFGRPVHWICCLHGGEVVPVEFAGVRAGNLTRGHRFLAPAEVALDDAASYLDRLRALRVLADPAERERVMLERLDAAAKAAGGVMIPDAFLVGENGSMVEEPHVICGHFDQAFLALPDEVTIEVMRGHQRYFALRGADGRLLNRYLAVVNTDRSPDIITQGNDRVLRARLADGRFFVEEDKKVGLAHRVPALDDVVFQRKLGSVGDRARRLEGMMGKLSDDPRGVEAARLCKADLVSLIVGEFPELQGAMGRWYLTQAGADAAVAQAVEEHYRPRGATDGLPGSALGAWLAVADRADLLAGCFGLGQVPSGSADPYGLRRAALGIIRVATAGDIQVDVGGLIGLAYDGYVEQGTLTVEKRAETLAAIDEFVRGRLAAFYRDNHRGDVVAAVLAAWPGDSVPDVEARLAIVAEVAAQEWEAFREAYKRAYNIAAEAPEGDFDPTLATEDAERALIAAWSTIRSDVDAHASAGRYEDALRLVGDLRDPIHRFFEDVFVMVDDAEVRDNRLRLLASIARTLGRIAHFHLLGGTKLES